MEQLSKGMSLKYSVTQSRNITTFIPILILKTTYTLSREAQQLNRQYVYTSTQAITDLFAGGFMINT